MPPLLGSPGQTAGGGLPGREPRLPGVLRGPEGEAEHGGAMEPPALPGPGRQSRPQCGAGEPPGEPPV